MNLTKRVKRVWADIVWTRREKNTTTCILIQKQKPKTPHTKNSLPQQTKKIQPTEQKQPQNKQKTHNPPSLCWPFGNLLEQ